VRRVSTRHGTPRGSGLVTLLVAGLLSSCGTGTGSDAETTRLPACTHGTADVRLGVFRETRREEVDAYERWLGCRVELVVDFGARPTWQVIAAPTYLFDEWAGSTRQLVLSVAMLPNEGAAHLENGARGEYDQHFRTLARNLVAAGQANAILRIGWEFNLRESRWWTDQPDVFVEYWRRIVAAMRSVPGQEFTFTWNPGYSGADAVPYYPGDDVVDHVGVDVYDALGAPGTYPYPEPCDDACRQQRQDAAWDVIADGERGLRFWSEFANSHGKPLALPEWGLWSRPDGYSGGNNVSFIERMHQFVSDPTNNVAYHAYFEFDGADGEHRLMTSFPEAGDVFRSLFAASAVTATATPARTP
jgi:hypothetical protein